MLKLKVPVKVLVSSASLTLVILATLILVSDHAYTSDIESSESLEKRATNDQSAAPVPSSSIANSTGEESSVAEKSHRLRSIPSFKTNNISRHRAGRLFGGSQSSGYENQQQQTNPESYAASYGAVGASSSQDQYSSEFSNSQANDASSFASFGETLPAGYGAATAASIRAVGRQVPLEYGSSSTGGYHSGATSYGHAGGSTGSSEAAYYGQTPSSYVNQYHPHFSKPTHQLGYPSNNYADRYAISSLHDRSFLTAPAAIPLWASSITPHGLMSSASSALSHWTGGFGLSEIICGLIALSIGAVILGAPFFLIYLVLMGNFSGSGTLSLTNPSQMPTNQGTQSTTVNGRRKRSAMFEPIITSNEKNLSRRAATLLEYLSPFVDMEQVQRTFNMLAKSIEKYSKSTSKMG